MESQSRKSWKPETSRHLVLTIYHTDMSREYDKFVCKDCERTSVIRPKSQSDRDAPKCASCSEATGGVSEMAWTGTVTEDELKTNEEE